MSGLPQSITCALASRATPAAASSRPSRIAAGMRPASELASGTVDLFELMSVTSLEGEPVSGAA